MSDGYESREVARCAFLTPSAARALFAGTTLATAVGMGRTIPHPETMQGQPAAVSAGPGPQSGSHTPRTIVTAIVLAVATASAGYVGGRVHGWSERRDTETQLEVASEEHQRAFATRQREHTEELARAQARADEQSSKAQALTKLAALYEGYRSSQRALTALDERNFGTSESHLRDAELKLSPLAEHVEGLPEVLSKLRGTSVATAGDLQEQRQTLLAIAAELDKVIVAERGP